ncbi:MAG: TIGR03960 family B12-binding radical SAM protein [Candidatus Omnitrophota bacterium]|nr:MAG: TIGR03960 family B12-binding radical SAM protein [Candidatus Omnitrophota bacterium]
MLEDILLQVEKPGRYIGSEWNIAKKDFDKCDVKFALCFPDLYELGMSNLGIRIIYGLLNSLPGVVCERFFSCWTDMENVLRRNKKQIFSLESKKGLGEFDLVGFSLGSELTYTNVLNILDLGAIPLEAVSRDRNFPLIIGGGPCVMNPEPLHDFFDLFIIGEAEEVLPELVGAYRKSMDKYKSGKLSKTELLIMLTQIEGVYAPLLYEVSYNPEGKIEKFAAKFSRVPAKVKKRFISDLNKVYFPQDWLLPYIQVVHDRITIEIMRGCPNSCRFCQARSQYFPYRLRGLDKILELTKRAYSSCGYEEVSLCGLSVSDHPQVVELLKKLTKSFQSKGISVSLPSIQPRSYAGELSALIATVKKTGITFAPEAATPRLLKILNKNFKFEDFFMALEEAYLSGYRNIKLYFMVGLPFEEREDLDGIIALAGKVSEIRRGIKPRNLPGKNITTGAAWVNLSINTLIPKPHTSFQWLGMPGIDKMISKYNYLKRQIKNKKIKLNFHNPFMSYLECVLSRGDRRLSRVISAAFKKGARFDSWPEIFKFEVWQEAFLETGISADFYLKERSLEEILPWDFLNIGITKEQLIRDYQDLLPD